MSDWIKTTTMDWFFTRIGQAAIGTGSCAVITSFKVGYGWVDESGAEPVLADLDGTQTDVPGAFFTGTVADGDMIVGYSGGVLLSQCTIATGELIEAQKASVIGLYDQDDELLAAAVFYPDWVTPDEDYKINVHMNFPTSGA